MNCIVKYTIPAEDEAFVSIADTARWPAGGCG